MEVQWYHLKAILAKRGTKRNPKAKKNPHRNSSKFEKLKSNNIPLWQRCVRQKHFKCSKDKRYPVDRHWELWLNRDFSIPWRSTDLGRTNWFSLYQGRQMVY